MVSRLLIKGGSYCCGLWGWRVMATPQDLVEVVSADPGPRERRACAESCFPWDAFVGDLISPRPFPLCLWSLQRFFLAGPGEFTAAIPPPPPPRPCSMRSLRPWNVARGVWAAGRGRGPMEGQRISSLFSSLWLDPFVFLSLEYLSLCLLFNLFW